MPNKIEYLSLKDEIKSIEKKIGKVFSDEKISGQVIEDLYFEGCTFNNCNFKAEQIKNTTFVRCIFINCDFKYQDIKKSEFLYSNFYESKNDTPTDFSFSSIEHSYFNHCNLTRASFKKSSLYGTKIENSKILGGEFHGTIFSHVISNKISLYEFVLNKCDLAYAIFENVNLQDCQLSESNISNALFSNCNLEATNLQYSVLKNTTFKNISGGHIDMTGAELSGIMMPYELIKEIIISHESAVELLLSLGCDVR